MNSQLIQLVKQCQEQELTPLAIAWRIERAIQGGQIVIEPKRPKTFDCVDCGQPMETIQQGQHTIVTCKHKDCTLYGVTLSTDQYAALSPIQLEGYRKMVASFKERHHE